MMLSELRTQQDNLTKNLCLAEKKNPKKEKLREEPGKT